MKWEYASTEIIGFPASVKLDEYGLMGWELVSVCNSGLDARIYVFKRPLTNKLKIKQITNKIVNEIYPQKTNMHSS